MAEPRDPTKPVTLTAGVVEEPEEKADVPGPLERGDSEIQLGFREKTRMTEAEIEEITLELARKLGREPSEEEIAVEFSKRAEPSAVTVRTAPVPDQLETELGFHKRAADAPLPVRIGFPRTPRAEDETELGFHKKTPKPEDEEAELGFPRKRSDEDEAGAFDLNLLAFRPVTGL